jgi:hypothetical protein
MPNSGPNEVPNLGPRGAQFRSWGGPILGLRGVLNSGPMGVPNLGLGGA